MSSDKTDWTELKKALSDDPKEKETGIAYIFKRYRGPLLGLFTNRLKAFGERAGRARQRAEDYVQTFFTELSTDEGREKWIKKADPEKGRFLHWLYGVGKFWLNDKCKEQLREWRKKAEYQETQPTRIESDVKENFRRDCLQNAANLALARMKSDKRHADNYKLLKRRYLRPGAKPSAIELAEKLGEISPDTLEAAEAGDSEAEAERKRVEDRMNKRLERARDYLRRFLIEEVERTLIGEETGAEREALIQARLGEIMEHMGELRFDVSTHTEGYRKLP